MIRLQAHGHTSLQSDSVQARDNATFLRGENRVLVTHRLGDDCSHLGDAGAMRLKVAVSVLCRRPVAKIAYSEMADLGSTGTVRSM